MRYCKVVVELCVFRQIVVNASRGKEACSVADKLEEFEDEGGDFRGVADVAAVVFAGEDAAGGAGDIGGDYAGVGFLNQVVFACQDQTRGVDGLHILHCHIGLVSEHNFQRRVVGFALEIFHKAGREGILDEDIGASVDDGAGGSGV